jgi:hypothetical protein
MEILAAAVSLIVALVGIHGDTWNPKAHGWRRLTRTGWITGSCALLAFGLAVVTALARRDEEAKAREQRETVNRIAKMEVCLAAANLKVAIDVLTSVSTGRLTSDGSDVGFGFDDLTSHATIEAIEKLDLLTAPQARPRVGDTRSLDVFVSAFAKNFIDQTNIVLAKYSTFLERDLILKSTWLVNHNVVRRFAVTAEQVAQLRLASREKYPGLWNHEREQYLEALQLLKDVLATSGGFNNGLTCKPPAFFRRTP